MSARSQSPSVLDVETHRLLDAIASSSRNCLAIDLAAASTAARHGIPWTARAFTPAGSVPSDWRGASGRRRLETETERGPRRRRAQAGRKRRRRAARRATGRASSDARPCAAAWSYSYHGAAGTGGSCGRDAGGPRPEPCIGACLCARAAETKRPFSVLTPRAGHWLSCVGSGPPTARCRWSVARPSTPQS